MIVILPIPPSINEAYGNNRSGKGRGRYKTKAYKAWIKAADGYLFTQKRLLKRIEGKLAITFSISIDAPVDVTNILKCGEDYLVSRELTADDFHNYEVTARRSQDVPPGMCHIEVRAA